MKPSEVIQQRGWIQGGLEDNRGVCVLGALHIACHSSKSYALSLQHSPLSPKCITGRCERVEEKVRSLAEWNDTPGRTVEQVIALLQEYEVEFESGVVETVEEKELVTA